MVAAEAVEPLPPAKRRRLAKTRCQNPAMNAAFARLRLFPCVRDATLALTPSHPLSISTPARLFAAAGTGRNFTRRVISFCTSKRNNVFLALTYLASDVARWDAACECRNAPSPNSTCRYPPLRAPERHSVRPRAQVDAALLATAETVYWYRRMRGLDDAELADLVRTRLATTSPGTACAAAEDTAKRIRKRSERDGAGRAG